MTPQMPYGRPGRRLAVAIPVVLATTSLVGTATLTLTTPLTAQAVSSTSVSEFQPNVTTKFGGRSVAIDVNPTNTQEAIAGTETGGVFKTTDKGSAWTHLDGLVPFRVNDVKYSANGSVMIVTTNPNADNSYLGGIWRSTDGGTTWSQPATAATLCGGNSTAYAIAYEAGSQEVYVGMQCGLAYSSDLGATWSINAMAQVGPVVAPSASEIDLCASDGFHRFSRSGSTLTQQVASSPGGFGGSCDVLHDLAFAPQETSVLYTLAGPYSGGGTGDPLYNLYESDDNGATWFGVDTNLDAGTRGSLFVGTHVAPGGGNIFTIIYGGSLGGPYINSCQANVPGARCVNLNSTRTNINVAHSDQNQVAFATDSSNCALYISSDGGVQTTTDCGADFVMAAGSGSANGGFNALQVYDLTGQTHPGGQTDLYFGTQDNNAYGSTDSGATWPGHSCCDAYDISVTHSAANNANEVATFDETGGKGQAAAAPGLASDQSWPNPPQACGTGCQYQNPWVIGPGQWVQAVRPNYTTSQSWYFWVATVTGTVPNVQVTWSGPATDSTGTAFTATGLDWRPRIVGPANNPTLFIGQNNGGTSGILKVTGLLSNTMVGTLLSGTGANQLQNLAGYGDNFVFTYAFAVDPGNLQHLIAYDSGDKNMKITTDGGQNWITNTQLTSLVGGVGRYCTTCETQPRAIRFDPTNPQRILVGTDNAGIVASTDGGATWTTMLGSSRVTDITDFFFDEVQQDILVSSYGRGLWKLDMTQRGSALSYTGPTSGDAGTQVTFRASLTDAATSTPVPGANLTMTLGTQSCSNPTDVNGNMSCQILLNQAPGNYSVVTSFAGDAQWSAASKTTPFVIYGWTQQHPANSATARDDAGMVYDPVHNQTVMFGGTNVNGNQMGSTWTWNGTTWTQQAPSESPGARNGIGNAMIWDAALGKVVLFGGKSGTGAYLNDTWTWDGTTWTQMTTSTSPPGREHHMLAYDSTDQVAVLFGGYNGAALSDTWELTATGWSQMHPATSPSARYYASFADDNHAGKTILFGGYNTTYLSDTWAWAGTNWTHLSPASSPSARRQASITYDSGTNEVVMFGGYNGGPLAETWLFDGSTWTQRTPSSAPSSRFLAPMAYGQSSSVVLFGGQNGTTRNSETWLWAP